MEPELEGLSSDTESESDDEEDHLDDFDEARCSEDEPEEATGGAAEGPWVR